MAHHSAKKGVTVQAAWEDDAVLLGRDDVSGYNEDNILPQSPDTLVKVRNWLRPTAYCSEESEFKKHLASHLDGTGQWLLDSQTYKDWHDSKENGLLWIRGVQYLSSTCATPN